MHDEDASHRVKPTCEQRGGRPNYTPAEPETARRLSYWISRARLSSSPAPPARSEPHSCGGPGEHDVTSIRVFSRDELKQSELAADVSRTRALRCLIGDVRDRDRLRAGHARRRRDRPRRRAQAGAGVRVQPLRGRADERHRRPERHRGGDRQRRAADDRAEHRQGRQPGQPLRRDEALRGEDLRPGQRLRRPARARASRPSATATSSAAAAA